MNCYFRLLVTPETKVCIVELNEYDELDYESSKFLRTKDGVHKLYFTTYNEAHEYALENLKHEHLDDELLQNSCHIKSFNASFYKD